MSSWPQKRAIRTINSAFVGISRRAESVDRKTLVQTFVDLGPLIPVLKSRDHQIVYGRRGTGKTHALLYVAEQLRGEQVLPVYIDLRNMGSSGGIYADPQIPLNTACDSFVAGRAWGFARSDDRARNHDGDGFGRRRSGLG